jgi:heptose-I-phosphate ethanolaminephosphotransferase
MFYFLAEDVKFADKCFAWMTCIATWGALSVIDFFLKRKGEKIYLTVLFILSIAPNLIVWSYLYLSRLYLRRDMFWSIFNTDSSEAQEYMYQFVPWECLMMAVLYLAIGIWCIYKAQGGERLSIKGYKATFAGSVLILSLIIGFQYLSQSVPMIEFYKSYLLFSIEHQTFRKEQERRKNLSMDVKCNLSDSTRHVFVVLIGESTASCHMSLYGYFRPTTPRMLARSGELDVFTDVIAPDTHTIGVLQKVLTLANHRHPEYYHKKPSIVEMYKAAGFTTYWISNQAFLSKYGGSYGVIASTSDRLYDLSAANDPDDILLPAFKEALADSLPQKKVIFIHLMGSHHAYSFRYPPAFAQFDHKLSNDLPDLGFRNDDIKSTIDEYDNSILYGDFVYDRILSELQEHDKNTTSAFLLFFSDHGEEVYDTRKASGHHVSNVWPCQCKVPFVLWRSERYKQENPNIVIDTERPYSTENLIHSLSTLSRLEYADYEPSLSIFSDHYIAPQSRMVGKESYEDILRKIDQ